MEAIEGASFSLHTAKVAVQSFLQLDLLTIGLSDLEEE
jgi:hypothetical protein